jgi:hypothetical protein
VTVGEKKPYQRSKNSVVLTVITGHVHLGLVGGGQTALTPEQARELGFALIELAAAVDEPQGGAP